MRVVKATLGVAVLGGMLFVSSTALAASTPAGGTVNVFATPGNGAAGTIVITGAIGDFGPTRSMNQNGTPNPNGNLVKLILKKGTIEVNITTINALSNKIQPTVNPMTCSGQLSVSAPATLFNGTGLYKGIAGTVHLTETFAFILPTVTSGAKKGQCNESNSAQPIAQYVAVIGTGTVHFS
jgi:hypothetical protein